MRPHISLNAKLHLDYINGRRNLNDFQRNEVALKYQEIIAIQMKEKMKLSDGRGAKKVRPNEQTFSGATTARKEMAKIAGTSEGSIQRSRKQYDMLSSFFGKKYFQLNRV